MLGSESLTLKTIITPPSLLVADTLARWHRGAKAGINRGTQKHTCICRILQGWGRAHNSGQRKHCRSMRKRRTIHTVLGELALHAGKRKKSDSCLYKAQEYSSNKSTVLKVRGQRLKLLERSIRKALRTLKQRASIRQKTSQSKWQTSNLG